MDVGGISGRHIMKVSGHKSESSSNSYSHFVSDKKKREISDTLSLALGLPNESKPEGQRNENDFANISGVEFEFEESKPDQCSDLDNILRKMNVNKSLAQVPNPTDQCTNVVQTQNQMDVLSGGLLNLLPNFF
jgi:hypothetical protein